MLCRGQCACAGLWVGERLWCVAAWGCVLRVGLRPGRRVEGVVHMASGITQPQKSRLRRELAVLGSGSNARSSGAGEKADT